MIKSRITIIYYLITDEEANTAIQSSDDEDEDCDGVRIEEEDDICDDTSEYDTDCSSIFAAEDSLDSIID